jgi:hypothetical protein
VEEERDSIGRRAESVAAHSRRLIHAHSPLTHPRLAALPLVHHFSFTCHLCHPPSLVVCLSVCWLNGTRSSSGVVPCRIHGEGRIEPRRLSLSATQPHKSSRAARTHECRNKHYRRIKSNPHQLDAITDKCTGFHRTPRRSRSVRQRRHGDDSSQHGSARDHRSQQWKSVTTTDGNMEERAGWPCIAPLPTRPPLTAAAECLLFASVQFSVFTCSCA